MDNQLEHYRCMVTPGHLAVSNDPAILSSVCGNGVIVILWDRFRKAGGMAHCIYPRVGYREKPTNFHADVALPALLRQMCEESSSPYHLEAQIVGGGNLRGFCARRAARVVKTARKILRRSHIAVVSEDVGGVLGRKVMFDTMSGSTVILKTAKVRQTDWAPEFAPTR